MIKRIGWIGILLGLLAACSSTGQGSNQLYGQMSTGIEATHTRH